MSVNQRIQKAVRPLSIPCAANEYTGEKPIYLVFTVSPLPVDFADDFPQHIKNLIQLHLYCPRTYNTVLLRKQIKKLISQAMFTYPIETDASEKGAQHIVFEFEDVEAV